jgi:3-oxoacyl-[acyl-carrier-protein] synthase III
LVLDHVEEGMRSRNSRFDSVRIKSTGSYVPSKILTNEEVVANLPTSPQWVVETLGIRERQIAEHKKCAAPELR